MCNFQGFAIYCYTGMMRHMMAERCKLKASHRLVSWLLEFYILTKYQIRMGTNSWGLYIYSATSTVSRYSTHIILTLSKPVLVLSYCRGCGVKMGNIVPRARIECTSLAFQASVRTIASPRLPDVTILPVYATTPCLRCQCRPLHH